jgi:hypothetical protein
MLRLKPSTIALAVADIREYDDRVRFKNHLKRCRVVEAHGRPSSPSEQATAITEADSEDSVAWSDDVTVDNGSPPLAFTPSRHQGKRSSTRVASPDSRSAGGCCRRGSFSTTTDLRVRLGIEETRAKSIPSTPTSHRTPQSNARAVSEGRRGPRRRSPRRRLTLPPPFSKTPRKMDLAGDKFKAILSMEIAVGNSSVRGTIEETAAKQQYPSGLSALAEPFRPIRRAAARNRDQPSQEVTIYEDALPGPSRAA